MEKDLISIIVPIYNVEKYIKRCIDSIIAQTYKNLEIILVDDGSPDDCGKICDAYAKKDTRIKVIHKQNGGLSDARNEGIKVANGKYIGFVDSDDWVHIAMFEQLYKGLIENHADISCCKFIRCIDKVTNIEKKFNHQIIIYNQMEYLNKFFKVNSQECVYYAWNKLYKRELLEENQYPIHLTAEDVIGTYKAILKCQKIAEIQSPYYYYYYNENSITGSDFSEKDFDLIKIWNQVVEITKKENTNYLELAKLNRYRIDYTLLMRMALALEFDQIEDLYDTQYKEMLKSLKQHKPLLLKSKIPFSRKVTIVLICWNYKKFVKAIKIINRRKRK